MAVRLQTARNTFLNAVQEFPKWMSMRKRPEKATSGLFLQALIEEQTDITAELAKFIKEFFLISYVGKESEIADYVYIVQVGAIDYTTSELIKPVLDITIDGKYFLDNMSVCALYQGGYFIISADNLPSDEILLYTYNDYKYGGKLQRYHIWNIFDEFAMFLGLNRFSDTGETNAQLLKRCFLVFSNPANSTRKGIQNTVMNCLSNEFDVDRNDIKVEIPDDQNVWLPYGEGTVYEHFVQLNRDIFRTKIWDSTWWEHNFKQLDYLSHVWDKPLSIYQDGVGQMQDLQVSLSQNDNDTTAVNILGFKKDTLTVNDYFRKHNIRDTVAIQLLKYGNVLNPRHVQYKITATPAYQINTELISLREQVKTEGINVLYLQDIISNSGYATVINPGILEKNKQYELVFKSRDEHSDMRIRKLELVDGNIINNLMVETRLFKMDGSTLKHVDVKKHITRTSELKSYNNLVDILEGFTLNSVNNTAVFTVDITGCGGKTVKISSYGDLFDLVEQTDRWVLDGLKLQDHKLVSDTVTADKGSATLNISCMGFSVKLLKVSGAQGAVNVKIFVNGVVDNTLSRLMTDPDIPIECWFDTMSDIKIVFTKSGSYPFEAEVKGTKYEITYDVSSGSVIHGPVSNYLSDMPDTVQNTLTVTVKSYDVKAPVIRYVHIGPSTTRASYTVKDIKPVTDNAYLDIDTDCKVLLYDVTDGQRQLISEDFSTKRSYRNDSNDDIYLEINVQQFAEILSSSKTIHKTARYGNTVSYITLHPDDVISSLTVNGIIFHDRALRTLDSLLNIDTVYNVYVADGADGFIVRNPDTGEEWLSRIPRSKLTEATVFSYEGLPDEISGVFVIDRPNNNKLLANSSSRNFDDTYLTIRDSQQYIAYNETDMYKSIVGKTENVNIISSMFYPTLPSNLMMFYKTETVESTDGFNATVVFKKLWKGNSNYFGIDSVCRQKLQDILKLLNNNELNETVENAVLAVNDAHNLNLSFSEQLYDEITELLSQGYWSLGKKELFLSTDFNFNNSDSFVVNVNSVNSTFMISSEIELQRNFDINGETVDLCCYVIQPPSFMKIKFDDKDDIIENGLIIKEDGFNKLKYSNIEKIDTLIINGESYVNYTLLADEGIIVWNDIGNLAGSYFSVAYTYKVPTGLAYTNLSYMYNKIGHDIDAFLPVNLATKLKKEYKDGDVITVEWEQQPDYVPAPVCSNSNFIATYNNGTVTVKQIYTDNVVLVKAGYYYDEDKEYYYYNHRYEKIVKRYNNIELYNVAKLDVIFQFVMATVNYVIHSNFKSSNNYEKLCFVKFNDPKIKSRGISAFNEITACDTYNMWRSYNMNVEFVAGLKDIGLLFIQEDETGYAVMNITDYVKPNNLISVFTTDGISLEIYREIKADDDSMVKTVFAAPFDTFSSVTGFQGYKVPQDIDLSYRYFLVVRGNGILDDMISRDNVELDDHFKLHVKNLENFGFTFDEKEESGTLLYLAFDRDGCNLDQLEITKDNTIQAGTNVDYGVTQIFDSRDRYDSFTAAETVIRKKGTFITVDKKGWIKTPFFYVENRGSAIDIYVKINNLISDRMKNFNVKYRTAVDEEGNGLIELGYVQKTNLVHFTSTQLSSYLQIEVEMDSNKIVDSVEVFIRYGENELVPLIIQNAPGGSLVTKVYDTVVEGSYRLKGVTGTFKNKENIRLYMRGCRQDKLYMVWTDWYEMFLNQNLETVFEPHIFDNYRLFQFKMEFTSDTATAAVQNFVLEVI